MTIVLYWVEDGFVLHVLLKQLEELGFFVVRQLEVLNPQWLRREIEHFVVQCDYKNALATLCEDHVPDDHHVTQQVVAQFAPKIVDPNRSARGP